MDDSVIEIRRIPDAADPDPDPRPAAKHGESIGAGKGDHPDDPEQPTTPYDHIWYDRRPQH